MATSNLIRSTRTVADSRESQSARVPIECGTSHGDETEDESDEDPGRVQEPPTVGRNGRGVRSAVPLQLRGAGRTGFRQAASWRLSAAGAFARVIVDDSQSFCQAFPSPSRTAPTPPLVARPCLSSSQISADVTALQLFHFQVVKRDHLASHFHYEAEPALDGRRRLDLSQVVPVQEQIEP